MATDDSQPSTPVRCVASEGLSSVSPSVVSSPASSSTSPDISAFLAQFRQAQAGYVIVENLETQMTRKREERGEAKTMAKDVRRDLKKCETKKHGRLKKQSWPHLKSSWRHWQIGLLPPKRKRHQLLPRGVSRILLHKQPEALG